MVLDKIYVEIRHPFGNEFTEMVDFENKGNSEDIEYIRKDALLEWAKEHYDRLKFIYNEIPASVVSGKMDAYKEIIDKIESL